MKLYVWDKEKNERLKEERKVSFEQVVFHLEHGNCLAVIEHHNQKKYSGQRIFVVKIEDYIFLVPFIEGEEEIFLKTIIPSRKATRDYLERGESDE